MQTQRHLGVVVDSRASAQVDGSGSFALKGLRTGLKVDVHGRVADLRLVDDHEQHELTKIARRLHAVDGGAAAVPRFGNSLTRLHINEVLEDLLDLLFPGLFHQHDPHCVSLDATRHVLEKMRKKLSRCIDAAISTDVWPRLQSEQLDTSKIVLRFFDDLPSVRRTLIDDARAACEADPAARSIHEVLLAYPGFIALAAHRLAHRLHALQVPLVPRMMSEWAHALTGIDIHPGATLGKRVFIDHGTGVVIGETAVVGSNVRIFHGVTLGAASTRHKGQTQRHPTIQDDVTLCAHATVLGGTTVIGRNSVIGAAVLIADSVPENSSVTAARCNVVKSPGMKA